MKKELIVFLVLFLVLLASCKKYEEGPLISLRSKEKRLCQKWDLKSVTKNGETLNVSNPRYQWEYHKNGNFTFYLIVSEGGDYWEYHPTESHWKWADDKESIETEPLNIENEPWDKYQIIKLKYKEMILERNDGTDLWRYVLKIE